MLNEFLTSTGSLTKRLEALANQPLQVQIIHQGFKSLSLDDRLFFAKHKPKSPAQSMAWVRQAHLYGNDDSPWILAKTIILSSELTGCTKRLRFLNTTPLGYVLFKRQQTLPHTRTFLPKNGNPARQTLYHFYGQLVLVEEIFLPNFVQKLQTL